MSPRVVSATPGLADAARAAFIDGLSGSLVAAAIVIAAGAVVVALRSPGRAPADVAPLAGDERASRHALGS